jgi:hypothetical protein
MVLLIDGDALGCGDQRQEEDVLCGNVMVFRTCTACALEYPVPIIGSQMMKVRPSTSGRRTTYSTGR